MLRPPGWSDSLVCTCPVGLMLALIDRVGLWDLVSLVSCRSDLCAGVVAAGVSGWWLVVPLLFIAVSPLT